MDCCVCSPLAGNFRPPRNTLCKNCFDGAWCILNFLQKLDTTPQNQPLDDEAAKSRSNTSRIMAFQGLSHAFNRMKELKDVVDSLHARVGFLEDFKFVFENAIHTDILIKPADGPAIPAHKAILASRSPIFRTMLEIDECKAPPTETITLPDLNHQQLHSLLQFLYNGSFPEEKIQKHAEILLVAADKYNIPFLQRQCELQILRTLNSTNALNILELSETCSNEPLKETALNTILKHHEEILFSERYDEFALANTRLSVEVTRALYKALKAKANISSLNSC
ncbi:BTB/POZ domain-containing protein At1g01640 [Amborella trichopoda]|uniref:BTB domain-containing protein n=1 Tax=Amborella trichopoda TaxID=13333 RepID=W1P8V5_AMBTC|nr:BTB/POZ domain-containing protein At1g01640 [Amborella trichopoda]ERN04104.1 hypothetical protein AMTR_s00077p00025220 [Amborella trichopoda]|eukprot:XP_006842429.1 BTB/POZ domain-containing protein At1g01640 [Amborella trichopoda]